MRTWLCWRFLIVAMLVLLPVSAAAQEAVITGTVKDSSDGVVPGVTVVAVHEATGNKFVAVTDAQGAYRLPVRIGGLAVTAELDGFVPARRTLSVLVGQTLVLRAARHTTDRSAG